MSVLREYLQHSHLPQLFQLDLQTRAPRDGISKLLGGNPTGVPIPTTGQTQFHPSCYRSRYALLQVRTPIILTWFKTSKFIKISTDTQEIMVNKIITAWEKRFSSFDRVVDVEEMFLLHFFYERGGGRVEEIFLLTFFSRFLIGEWCSSHLVRRRTGDVHSMTPLRLILTRARILLWDEMSLWLRPQSCSFTLT